MGWHGHLWRDEAGLGELDKALAPNRISRMLLLTDGQTFGDEEACKKLGKQAGSQGIVVSALGLGDDWNEDLLDEVAEASGGKATLSTRPTRSSTFSAGRPVDAGHRRPKCPDGHAPGERRHTRQIWRFCP